MQRAKQSRKKDFLILAGLLALFLLGLAGLAAATGWQESLKQLAKLTGAQVAVLLALSLVNYLLRALRWHLFAHRLGVPTTLAQNILHFIGGFAMTITPGRVGELVRLRWITRLTNWSFERLTPLPLVDRAYDMAALGVVLGASVALTQSGSIGPIVVAILAVGAAILATRPRLLILMVETLWHFTRRFPRPFARLRQAAGSLAQFSTARVALPAFVLSVIGWLAEGVAFYLLLLWMGAEIALPLAVLIFIFSSLAGGLTGAPGGLGGAEAAMVFLLSLQDVPLEVSIPATAVIRITTLWFAIAIGVMSFPLAEKFSYKA